MFEDVIAVWLAALDQADSRKPLPALPIER